MGHGITDTDEVLSVREMPWHKLGVVLPDYPTREEAQRIAHPWEPVEQPVFHREISMGGDGPEEQFLPIPGRKIIERDDTGDVLGVVNDSYGIVSNNDMWDVAEAVGTLGTDTQIETAGSYNGGRNVWILLRLTKPLEVHGDPSQTLAYFSIQNSFDGTGSFRGQAHNTRIVCANTSAAADLEADRTDHEFTFRHSSGVQDRMEQARQVMHLWREDVDEWRQVMDFLAGVQVTTEQIGEFIERFQPMPNGQITDRVRNNVNVAREELGAILGGYTQTMDQTLAHTGYGLFQAAVEWSQHVRQSNTTDPDKKMLSVFKRSLVNDGGVRRATAALVKEVCRV